MIEYLEKLVEEREFTKGLSLAERLLLDSSNTRLDLLKINAALLTCRLETGEYLGAIVAGEVALKLARDLCQWDYYGKICWDLGASHEGLRQLDEAISYWFEYTSKLHAYTDSVRFEASIWFNIGNTYSRRGEFDNAYKFLLNALNAANRMQSARYAHGVRQALVSAFVRVGKMAPIPRLLAQCQSYIRKNPQERNIETSRLWLMLNRAEYARVTNRLGRARVIALKGLGQANVQADLQHAFHLVLAKIARDANLIHEALGHSLSARICAIQGHRYDLEAVAADLTYDITSKYPQALEELDKYYLAVSQDDERSLALE